MTRAGMTGILFGVVLLLNAQVGIGAYITDKLLAGFYASPDLTSEPVRALPNGTPMEVLEEQGKFSRIRLGDNSEGWVETRFVTQEKPAKTMLLELQAKYADLKRQLDDSTDTQRIETPAITESREEPIGIAERIHQPKKNPVQGAYAEAGETADQQRMDTFHPWLLPLIMLGLLLSFIGGIAFKNYRIARRARQVGKPE